MPADNPPLDGLFAAVVDAATDAILAVDDEQRIVLFNPAAEVLFRCPAAEALGQPLDRFLPERFRASHRRFVDGFRRTGATSRSMGHLRPLAALRADGEEFPIEATISRTQLNGRTYLAAILRDVTVARRAEAELRRRAELLDNTHDAILAWKWTGEITYWNRGAERLYGFTAEEALGRICHDLLDTRYPDGRRRALETLDRDGVWEGELAQTTRSGAEIVVDTRQIVLDEGGVRVVLEANRDVSARRQAELERAASLAAEEAARAEAIAARELASAREQILSTAAHELRNPLTVVVGFAHLLDEQLRHPELDRDLLREFLTDLKDQADRLDRLVCDLLDASRIQQGRLALEPEPADLSVLAQEVLARFARPAEATTRPMLELDAAGPVVGVWDPTRLDQVLTNLVGNAVKYSPPGSPVTLRVRRRQRGAEVQVRDRGIGIPAEEQPRLFQPFARASNGREFASGTGLGLYIAAEIVRLHGGSIEVASEVGSGSTFTVRLPLAAPA